MFVRIYHSLLFLAFFQLAIAQSNGELLIFVQTDQPISQNLLQEDLQAIQQMASEQALTIKIIEIADNVPVSIDFTPAIVFQNHLGRSVYRGRYKAIDRLTNFVRTAKWQATPPLALTKTQILIHTINKTTLASPIKITDLAGELPTNYKEKEFKLAAQNAIIVGMEKMAFHSSVDLPSLARLFYMDFYPYRNPKGELFINTRLYSMFSCVVPVFQSQIPIKGNFNNFEQLFQEAGQLLEQQLFVQLKNTKYGDGLEPINGATTTITFEALGYPIPEAPIKETISNNNNHLPTADKWIFDQTISEGSPALQFQFPAPLDHYAGEAKALTMQLKLREPNNLMHAKGVVKVATQSITMGDQALDDHVLNEYILADKFPVSSYKFMVVDGPSSLSYGELAPIQLEGIFQMRGIETVLPAKGTLELTLNENGEPRLHITGQFNLELWNLFGIKGPDGPKEASNVLQFRLNFLMKPADDFTTAKNFDNIAETYTKSFKKTATETQEKPITAKTNSISWKASTLAYKANGSFENWQFTQIEIPNGDLEKIEVTAEIDLHSITEKSKLLVKHVKSDKFFEVEKYPTAKFNITHATRNTAGIYEGEAIVKMKGISATIPFSFQVINTAPLSIKGNCLIDRSVFGIGKVKKKGGVSRNVEVEIVANLETALKSGD